jgi:two-component system CheB/CheR fusion protein
LLIYLNPEIQQRLIPLFHYALSPGGLLMLGTSETIGGFGELFAPRDRKWKLYERRQSATRFVPMSGANTAPHPAPAASFPEPRPGAGAFSFPARVEKVLLERFVPPTVVVNDRGDIVYIHGKTGAYLEPSPGEPRNNLFAMAREGLRIELPSAVRRASVEGGEIVHNGLVIGGDDRVLVNLRARRIEDPEPLRGLFRISFEKMAAPEKGAKPIRKQHSRAGLYLERELAQTRDTLQGTIEALQTSNEELKSSNEELQSTNEELQSSNEELETSKEELQSLNEELHTVNAELQAKMDEVARANDDMQNLLNSTEIATLFLDRDLKIQRFTDQTREIIPLIPSDIGRSVGDLVAHWRYRDLTEDARRVLETLVPHEVEVQTTRGEWRLLRMMPYRTSQNMIDGVVVTLVDIDRVKRAELLASSREFAHSIVQTVREPLVVLDTDFCVLSANQAFFRAFRLEPQQVEKHSLFEIGNGILAMPRLRELLQEIVARGSTLQDVEIEHDWGEIGRRSIVLNARRLEGEGASAGQILLALGDATRSPFR